MDLLLKQITWTKKNYLVDTSFYSNLLCAHMFMCGVPAGVSCSHLNRWMFPEPIIARQRPWAEEAGCSALKRLRDQLRLPCGVADGWMNHRMWRIEQAAVFCVAYLRGSRRWHTQVILSPWQQFARQGVDWKLADWKHVGVERRSASIKPSTSAHQSALRSQKQKLGGGTLFQVCRRPLGGRSLREWKCLEPKLAKYINWLERVWIRSPLCLIEWELLTKLDPKQ